MRTLTPLLLIVVLTAPVQADPTFIRGDANGDGGVDIGDAVFTLEHLFQTGPAPCQAALDTNDDESVDVSDAVYLLNALFVGTLIIPAPHPGCGIDPSPSLITCAGPVPNCPDTASEVDAILHETAHPISETAQGVAAGDFNGDGIIDLVALDRSPGLLSVLLGEGGRRYSEPTIYSLGSNASSIHPVRPVVADMDLDGNLDILGGTWDGLCIRYGNGDGTFPVLQQYATPGAFYTINVTDLNLDGIPDAVLTSRTTPANHVFLGDGLGGLTLNALTFPEAFSSHALGDFNNDAFPDLLFSDFDGFLQFWPGDGAGGFTFASEFPQPAARRLQAADYNGDGNLDLAFTIFTTETVVLRFGNGDGTFGTGLEYSFPDFVRVDEARDVNEDGTIDLIVQTNFEVLVYPGLGAGAFGAPIVTYRPVSGGAFTLVDLDGDTTLDFAECRIGTLYTLRGVGDGSFLSGGFSDTPVGDDPAVVELADFDGDGHLDVAVVDRELDVLHVLLSSGDGTFEPSDTRPLNAGPNSMASGDLDSDGFVDLVVAHDTSSILVFFGLGDGTVEPGVELAIGNGPRRVRVVDIDGDGDLDIIATNYPADEIGVLAGNGDGSFVLAAGIPAGTSPRSITTSDVNGDGILDIVTTDYLSASIGFLAGLGGGSFAPIQLVASGSGVGVAWIETADLNGDGLLDAVVGNIATDDLTVLLGNGAGSWTPLHIFEVPEQPLDLRLVDLNADGFIDIVTLLDHVGFGLVEVRRGNGDGSFEAPERSPAVLVGGFDLGDVDNDGDQDVVTASPLGPLRILENLTAP